MEEAKVIVLKKFKKLAPEFHRHIVKSKLQNQTIKKGERHLVYEVEDTIPEGKVLVTGNTTFEFV